MVVINNSVDCTCECVCIVIAISLEAKSTLSSLTVSDIPDSTVVSRNFCYKVQKEKFEQSNFSCQSIAKKTKIFHQL